MVRGPVIRQRKISRMEATLSAANADLLRTSIAASRRCVWLGALSFEERCTGSLIDLKRHGLRVTEGVALSYATDVRPLTEAEKQRNSNWNVMRGEVAGVFEAGIEKQGLPAYGFLQLQDLLEERVWKADFDLAIFDITCLTKVHSLALAASIARCRRRVPWIVSYTIPENYSSFGHSLEESPGWKDIILAPLSETGLLFNESNGRGILIPGHEPDRLIVALAEIEPAGGLIAIADTQGRPDLRHLSERRNQKVIRQLTRLRASNWIKQVVKLTDLQEMSHLVATEVKHAKDHEAPVILFPYGPKPLVFASALQLSLRYPEASWFVYPIPLTYDVSYSEGIYETDWFLPTTAPS